MADNKTNEYRNLRTMLTIFKNSTSTHCCRGNWKIATGGYDLWFEIYYKDEAKIRCIDGELEIGNDRDINVKEVLKIVKEILDYVK